MCLIMFLDARIFDVELTSTLIEWVYVGAWCCRGSGFHSWKACDYYMGYGNGYIGDWDVPLYDGGSEFLK